MTATATQSEKVEPEVGQLLAGWVETTLGAVRSDVSKGILPSNTPDQVFDLYSIPNFPLKRPEVLAGKAIGSNKQTTHPGAVLLSKINPRISRVWVVGPASENPQIASTEWISFGRLSSLEPAYIAFFMQQNSFRDHLAANVSGVGGSLTRTNTAVVDRYPFPLPPLAEQGRIVTKIEELFSKLDAGVAELKRTRALLKRYRQSVLHAAVTGELSRGWREAQGDELEDAGHLLAHILDERRARWAISGKKGKYAEPKGPDVVGLPGLPSGWVWATLPQLGELGRGKSKHRPRNAPHLYGGPYPFIQTGDVRRSNGLIKYFDQTYNELGLLQSRLWKAGTLCITIAANIAETGILSFSSCFPDSVVGFVPENPGVFVEFYEIFLRSEKSKIEQYAPATAQKNINLDILNSLAMPLPPSEEQSYIVSEVERRLSILANVEATVEAELKRAESMRQGILRRAFAGQLVPQDAADEPASVLLERIQAERLAVGAAAVRATGKRGRKAKTAPQVMLLGPADA